MLTSFNRISFLFQTPYKFAKMRKVLAQILGVGQSEGFVEVHEVMEVLNSFEIPEIRQYGAIIISISSSKTEVYSGDRDAISWFDSEEIDIEPEKFALVDLNHSQAEKLMQIITESDYFANIKSTIMGIRKELGKVRIVVKKREKTMEELLKI